MHAAKSDNSGVPRKSRFWSLASERNSVIVLFTVIKKCKFQFEPGKLKNPHMTTTYLKTRTVCYGQRPPD